MNDYFKIAKIFKAFDDEKRLQILEMLRYSEKCACDILENIDISQPTLSHHMKILCDSGIVNCEKRGKWCFYSVSEFGIKIAMDFLRDFSNKNFDFNS